jgi:hypothetical protein
MGRSPYRAARGWSLLKRARGRSIGFSAPFDKGFWTRRMITANKGTCERMTKNLLTAN